MEDSKFVPLEFVNREFSDLRADVIRLELTVLRQSKEIENLKLQISHLLSLFGEEP
jgi:cell division protein FtsL